MTTTNGMRVDVKGTDWFAKKRNRNTIPFFSFENKSKPHRLFLILDGALLEVLGEPKATGRSFEFWYLQRGQRERSKYCPRDFRSPKLFFHLRLL